MLKTMAHEPFYVTGMSSVPEMGVCAGWVAHPGSFAARESEAAAAQDVSLVFAGECFQDDGPQPPDTTASRNELPRSSILMRYHGAGEKSVEDLNGVFSGLIIDRGKRETFLFNDRYGLERIYIHQTADATYFASEAKALLRVVPQLRAFDDAGVAEFLAFGCTLESRTLFRGVERLAGGALWSFGHGTCLKRRYFTPDDWETQTRLPAHVFESEFEERFRGVLPRYARSGVRIGISLTGGLDTRMIMAHLPALAKSPLCYTFAGISGETLDAKIAGRVAATCGLEHYLLRIKQEFLANFGSYADRTVYITDGCLGPLGAHEIYLNSLARELAPVRLTGNFGSEILRAASTIKPVGLSVDLIHKDLQRQVDETGIRSMRDHESAVTAAAFRGVPSGLFGTLAAARSQVVFRTPFLDNELVSLAYRAPAHMRQSPGAALRLVRRSSPDLSRIPTDRAVMVGRRGGAYALRRVLSEAAFKLDYLYMEALPHWLTPFDAALGSLAKAGVVGMHKFLPYRPWFRGDLAEYVKEVLIDPATMRSPYWNQPFLAKMAHNHISGRANHVREINAVATLSAVDRLLLRS